MDNLVYGLYFFNDDGEWEFYGSFDSVAEADEEVESERSLGVGNDFELLSCDNDSDGTYETKVKTYN